MAKLNTVLDWASLTGLAASILIQAAEFLHPQPESFAGILEWLQGPGSGLTEAVTGIVLGAACTGFTIGATWLLPQKSIKQQNENLKELLELYDQKQRQIDCYR